jgi:hypothetical protein
VSSIAALWNELQQQLSHPFRFISHLPRPTPRTCSRSIDDDPTILLVVLLPPRVFGVSMRRSPSLSSGAHQFWHAPQIAICCSVLL